MAWAASCRAGRRRLTRGMVALAALGALGAGGCGGDKTKPTSTASPPPANTGTSNRGPAGRTATGSQPPAVTAVPRTTTSPEKQPAGAGDESGNRAQAMLVGRGGRISPRVVRVPPYIAIRVELRSADGRSYGLRFRGRSLRAGGQLAAVSASFPGLRPGQALVGRPQGGGEEVRIEANAEPGP